MASICCLQRSITAAERPAAALLNTALRLFALEVARARASMMSESRMVWPAYWIASSTRYPPSLSSGILLRIRSVSSPTVMSRVAPPPEALPSARAKCSLAIRSARCFAGTLGFFDAASETLGIETGIPPPVGLEASLTEAVGTAKFRSLSANEVGLTLVSGALVEAAEVSPRPSATTLDVP